MKQVIYLDNNATTEMLPEVADAIREASLRYSANPSSQHQRGREARRVLEEARARIGQLLGLRNSGMTADRLVFTSGGTEANQLAIRGLAAKPGRIVVSQIEHPSVAGCLEQLEQQGWQIGRVPAKSTGEVAVEQIAEQLTPETRMVVLMLGNHETGVLQPVAEVAALCAERGIALHTDAAQVVGKLPVDFAALNVATLSCAAHKFHGPLGIAALAVRYDVTVQPMWLGGHQQAALRPGTESVALAVGMQVALECWHTAAQQRRLRMTELRDRFENTLCQEIADCGVIGADASRLPHTSNLAFRGLDRQALMMALDLEGVACSTGSACASGSSEPSPVLIGMGLPEAAIQGAIRFSLGSFTTQADVDEGCRRIIKVCNRLQRG